MSKLTAGKIPAHTECPFIDQCSTSQNGRCNHKGKSHNVPYSCGLARAFDTITYKETVATVQRLAELPNGWVATPTPGTRVRSSHPITTMNPDDIFEVVEVKIDGNGKAIARGEKTCWFGVAMLSPVADGEEPKRPSYNPDDWLGFKSK